MWTACPHPTNPLVNGLKRFRNNGVLPPLFKSFQSLAGRLGRIPPGPTGPARPAPTRASTGPAKPEAAAPQTRRRADRPPQANGTRCLTPTTASDLPLSRADKSATGNLADCAKPCVTGISFLATPSPEGIIWRAVHAPSPTHVQRANASTGCKESRPHPPGRAALTT